MTNALDHDAAIAAALHQDWPLAIQINSDILKVDPKSVDALTRLGFAYQQSGNLDKAKTYYHKALKIDPYNHIAQKNIKKLDSALQQGSHIAPMHVSPLMFLEEPGITKIALCVNLAPQNVLSTICPGHEVTMKAKNHCVEIRDTSNVYLGALPDDISFKLLKYLEGENTYSCVVKSVGKNQLAIFIRELSRGKKFANHPSFTPTKNYAGTRGGDTPVAEHVDTPVVVTDEEEPEDESQA